MYRDLNQFFFNVTTKIKIRPHIALKTNFNLQNICILTSNTCKTRALRLVLDRPRPLSAWSWPYHIYANNRPWKGSIPHHTYPALDIWYLIFDFYLIFFSYLFMIVYPWSESNRLVISSDVAQWGKQAPPPKHKPDTYICQRELHAHPFPFLS